MLEARDLNHAIQLTSKHPGVKASPFEIRPALKGHLEKCESENYPNHFAVSWLLPADLSAQPANPTSSQSKSKDTRLTMPVAPLGIAWGFL